jgi:hypothetical protein
LYLENRKSTKEVYPMINLKTIYKNRFFSLLVFGVFFISSFTGAFVPQENNLLVTKLQTNEDFQKQDINPKLNAINQNLRSNLDDIRFDSATRINNGKIDLQQESQKYLKNILSDFKPNENVDSFSVNMDEKSFSKFDDIVIPVLPLNKADSITPTVDYETKQIELNFLFSYQGNLPNQYNSEEISSAKKIIATGKFQYKLSFNVPMIAKFTYPKEVFEGMDYSLTLNMEPFNRYTNEIFFEIIGQYEIKNYITEYQSFIELYGPCEKYYLFGCPFSKDKWIGFDTWVVNFDRQVGINFIPKAPGDVNEYLEFSIPETNILTQSLSSLDSIQIEHWRGNQFNEKLNLITPSSLGYSNWNAYLDEITSIWLDPLYIKFEIPTFTSNLKITGPEINIDRIAFISAPTKTFTINFKAPPAQYWGIWGWGHKWFDSYIVFSASNFQMKGNQIRSFTKEPEINFRNKQYCGNWIYISCYVPKTWHDYRMGKITTQIAYANYFAESQVDTSSNFVISDFFANSHSTKYPIIENSYDFSMNVINLGQTKSNTTGFWEGQSIWITRYTTIYEVNLQPLDYAYDEIMLSVSGLPSDHSVCWATYPSYFSIDNCAPNTYTKSIIRYSGQLAYLSPILNKMYLSISTTSESLIDVAPGQMSFIIKGESNGKKGLGLSPTFLTTSVSLNIPEAGRFTLNTITRIDIYPNQIANIGFSGRNTKNVFNILDISYILNVPQPETGIFNISLERYSGKSSSTTDFYEKFIKIIYNPFNAFPPPGSYKLEIKANSRDDPSKIATRLIIVNFKPYYSVNASITPSDIKINANGKARFDLTITNTGNYEDNYTIKSSGWNNFLEFEKNIVKLESGKNITKTVSLNIPDPSSVPIGSYEFRIVVYSDGVGDNSIYSTVTVSVTLLPPDLTPPGIDRLQIPLSGEYIYAQSDSGPSWSAFDNNPGVYDLYINGSLIESLSWTSGMIVKIPSNSLSVGIYNITIIFRDNLGNSASDQVWMTVKPVDTINPQLVSGLSTLSLPENFVYPISLTWNCTEEFIKDYRITRNGVNLTRNKDYFVQLIEINKYQFSLTIPISSLPSGSWNYSLIIDDMGGYHSISSTVVTVSVDNDSPSFSVLPSILNTHNRGEQLKLTILDAHPDKFELFAENKIISSGTWISGISVNFSIDNLPLKIGTNHLMFKVYDLAGNTNLYSWNLLIVDIDVPQITFQPSDITAFEHNSTFEDYYWIITDNDPSGGIFIINVTGQTSLQGTWTNNTEIKIPLSGLEAGTYKFSVTFYDTSGNNISTQINIVVLDILPPQLIMVTNLVYEPLFTPNWFEVSVSENHYPVSYQISVNGTQKSNGILNNDYTNIFSEITTLKSGYYNYSITVEDSFGNVDMQSLAVFVGDSIRPLIQRSSDLIYSEGNIGNNLSWEIIEAQPKNYSIYQDKILKLSGVLNSTNLSISVDGLTLGNYSYTLIVYDQNGLSHSTNTIISIVDIIAPSLSHLNDIRFVQGDEPIKVIWKAYDLHPDSYTVQRAGTTIINDIWTGGDIFLNLVGWPIGSHQVDVTVKDKSGNVAKDTLLITLIDTENVVTISKADLIPSTNGFTIVFFAISLVFIFLKKKTKI